MSDLARLAALTARLARPRRLAGLPRAFDFCGGHVGAGAKILGPVTIGKGAKTGANVVITKDVHCYGVPASVV